MEGIERRTLAAAITVAIVLAFDTPNFSTQVGRGWEVMFYVLGLAALGAAATLLAFAIAPREAINISQVTRERLLFVAFVLTMGAILEIALLRAYTTYWLHKHGQF